MSNFIIINKNEIKNNKVNNAFIIKDSYRTYMDDNQGIRMLYTFLNDKYIVYEEFIPIYEDIRDKYIEIFKLAYKDIYDDLEVYFRNMAIRKMYCEICHREDKLSETDLYKLFDSNNSIKYDDLDEFCFDKQYWHTLGYAAENPKLIRKR